MGSNAPAVVLHVRQTCVSVCRRQQLPLEQHQQACGFQHPVTRSTAGTRHHLQYTAAALPAELLSDACMLLCGTAAAACCCQAAHSACRRCHRGGSTGPAALAGTCGRCRLHRSATHSRRAWMGTSRTSLTAGASSTARQYRASGMQPVHSKAAAQHGLQHGHSRIARMRVCAAQPQLVQHMLPPNHHHCYDCSWNGSAALSPVLHSCGWLPPCHCMATAMHARLPGLPACPALSHASMHACYCPVPGRLMKLLLRDLACLPYRLPCPAACLPALPPAARSSAR